MLQGKKFRADLAMALLASNTSDMIVQCNVGALGHPDYNKISHRQLMQYLSDSVFCPVLPGDDQSSQHLTERYLMGCIPVFVGPPYHAMPFEKEIDYGASAVFINVTNSSSWLGDVVMQWSYPAIPEVRPAIVDLATLDRDMLYCSCTAFSVAIGLLPVLLCSGLQYVTAQVN
jgi:hypothetical protein